ncbi:MAG: helicase C-terminal domain-containing protein, partial [Spirochaetota bacterium]
IIAPPMQADERLYPEPQATIKEAIADAGGNEVLFVCSVDDTGMVSEVRIRARGNPVTVLAPAHEVERGDVIIHNHPSGTLSPSGADLEVASQLSRIGVGMYIVDNEVDRVYVVTEPLLLEAIEPLDTFELVRLIDDDGPLAGAMPSFEVRESQQLLLEAVAEAFGEDRVLFAEAGTGVGKSLAYLIPALAWAKQNNERIVVSTATINLQQQLVEKDIPIAQRLLGSDVSAVLVKGRGNYLCRARLEEELKEQSLFNEESADLEALREWAEVTETGSRSDAPFYPADSLWERVNSDPDSCSAAKCRSQKPHCFVVQARRRAAKAHILIVNHHLLFSDLSLRLQAVGFDATAVLPPFKRLIFDEAHEVETSATSFFSESFSRLSIAKQLRRLVRRKRGRELGILSGLAEGYGEGHAFSRLRGLIPGVEEAAAAIDATATASLREDSSLWLRPDSDSLPPASLREGLEALRLALGELLDALQQDLSNLPEEATEDPLFLEARGVYRRLGRVSELCGILQDPAARPDSVCWLELSSRKKGDAYTRFTVSPLEIGNLMKEAVYDQYPSVLFLSATLTIQGSFEFYRRRLGSHHLEADRLVESTYPSPFAFRERVLLGIPTDGPLPTEEGYETFLAKLVLESVERSGGGALILFTSYQLLMETYGAVAPTLRERGISCLYQGEDERSRLLGRFSADMASVLFATDSFWAGVDAPGETLKLVVVTRLPFRVPTHPVTLARMAAIERTGGNPFMDFSVPEAITRLRQGFGRLMRHRRDRGVVLIADARIVKKQYGSLFLASLPETQRIIAGTGEVFERVERFLEETSE